MADAFIPKGSFITTYLGSYLNQNREKQQNEIRKHKIGFDLRRDQYQGYQEGIRLSDSEADFRATMYTVSFILTTHF